MGKKNIGKNVKWIIIVVLCILVYIGLALFINNQGKGETDNYLIVGNNLIWHEIKGKWYQEVEASDDILNRKYTVYSNNQKYEADSAQYVSDEWYFFDKDYKRISNDNFRLAYTKDVKVKLADVEIQGYDSSDDIYISKAINPSNQVQWNNFRNRLNKVSYDFDNDGVLETVYITSNSSLTVEDYDFNSYLFLVKNDSVINVIKGGADPYGIIDVLDIDNDGNYEIIISKGIINNATLDSCYQIYKIINGKIVLMQDCLINKN